MKTKILFLIIIMMVLLVISVSSTELVFVDDFCIRGQDCTFNDLFLTGNFTFIGNIINVTILNQNITGQMTIGGTLNVNGNITADNFIGNGSLLTGIFNSSLWDRSGSNTILKNIGDNVGIGIVNPLYKLHVDGIINSTEVITAVLNVTGNTSNSTFAGDVKIIGKLSGGSPLKIVGGINLSSVGITFADLTFQDTASNATTTFVLNALDNGSICRINSTCNGNLTLVDIGTTGFFVGNLDTGTIQITDDIDKEHIEGDFNTFVDIGGDNMTGTLFTPALNTTFLNVSRTVTFSFLNNCDTIDTDSNGQLSCGTDDSGFINGSHIEVGFINVTGDTFVQKNITKFGSPSIYFEDDNIIFCLGC